VRDVLNIQTGAVVASYDYDAYGQLIQSAGTTATDFRYAGMFNLQGAGLYLTNYRAYDPNTGRWLSRDPIGEDGGINLYGYVNENPVSFIDPKGLEAVIPFPASGAVGGAASGALGPALGFIGGLIYPSPVGEGSDIIPPMEANFPPGYWPGDKGAIEWGKRNGVDPREAKDRFHKGIKPRCHTPGAKDNLATNPENGDVIDGNGDYAGNLGNDYN